MVEPRIVYIDIEVLQEGTRFPSADVAERPIIAFTIYDNYTQKYVTCVQREDLKPSRENISKNHLIIKVSSEQTLIDALYSLLSKLDPDIVTAWNTSFDIKYITNRIKKLNIDYDIDEFFEDRQVFDLLSAYRKINNLPSYTLEYVAKVEGLVHKTEVAEDIPWIYKNDLDRLIIYNFTDVKIIKELDEKRGIIPMFWQLKAYVGTPDINDCFNFSVLLDNVLLRLAKDEGICLPSKQKGTNDGYAGAIVFEPVHGIHNGVAVLDMSKFYPSIILSLNISPETINKVSFGDKVNLDISNKTGLIPKMVLYLKKEREMYEKQMKNYDPGTPEYEDLYRKRQVVKDLLNAVYGFLGYSRSRVFTKELAELVTYTARSGLLWVRKQSENMGYTVIYGDTDSVFVKIPEYSSIDDIVDKGKELAEIITKSFDTFAKEYFGITKHYFSLDFEKVLDPVFFLSDVKKRYAGIVKWEKGKHTDYLLVKGFEVRRSDTSEITKDLQMKVIEMILRNEPVNKIVSYVKDIVKRIKSGEVNIYDLAISKGIQRRIESYGVNGKNLPFHIRAALYSNKYFGTNFDKGDKIKVLYIKRIEGYPLTDVIAFTDNMKLPEVLPDYEKMIDVTVRSKVEKLLELKGISWNKIVGKKNLFSLVRK